MKLTATAIAEYRAEAAYAACLTRAGAEVTARPDDTGVPRISAERRPEQCKEPKGEPDAQTPQDLEVIRTCESEQQFATCLQRVFNERVGSAAPPRLVIRLGVRDESPPTLAAAPTMAVAGGVALAAVLGALLLSRAVLRPVRAMTLAAGGLGEGDLGRRVPVSGRDEIAQLGRAFNRMAESIQAVEERQRRLTGDIAHELRTPLANLRGYLEALRDGVVEPTPELLDSLHEEALLQQRIVDDLQDLALAEAGALTYHRVRVDLRELLEAAGTAHRAQADAAGVALRLEAPRPVDVIADADRLRQVVGNLVGNALRATAPGGTVTLALGRHGDLALLEVRDTGKGIPAEDLPHLFDRFWRADAARGRATGGSGLGLSIARQIVTDHQGTIAVESTVGVGTAFTVTLATTGPSPPTPLIDRGQCPASAWVGADPSTRRYPRPYTVSRWRGRAGSSPSFRRRLRTWASTVRSSTSLSKPKARSMIWARVNTRPGSRARASRIENSLEVSATGRPATRTSKRAVSSSTAPTRSTSFPAAPPFLERRSSARTRAVSSRGLYGLVR